MLTGIGKKVAICGALCALGLALSASAPVTDATTTTSGSTRTIENSVKPAAVIYFNDGSDIAREHATMVSRMVRELSSNYSVPIKEVPLSNEAQLPARMEKIADEDIGLVLIIEPQNNEALAKIPSLYPDINFSIIGTTAPLYFTNVRAMHFRDQEGTFMMGALAALRTQNGTIAFASKDDTADTRNLAYGFLQGAKHANPEIKVVQLLGLKLEGTKAATLKALTDSGADILFIQDEELLDAAAQNARAHKQILIANNHDVTSAYPGLILTSILKHYDLAMYQTFRSYSRSEWKPGSQTMGIGNGFIDYVLGGSNKSLLPKETVEQIETTKDFVSQGLLQVNTLVQ